MSYNCQKRSKPMSQSKFSKFIVSLALLILPIIAGGQLAYANPGDVNCSYAAGVNLSSPALGDDGTIYSRSSNTLFAINPNCTLKWTYPSGSTTNPAGFYISSPVIADDGTIYFLSGDGLNAVTPGSTGATLKW